jgi:hypothetical protein
MEWHDLNVVYCCDEQDPLQRDDCRASNGTFVKGVDNTCIVASNSYQGDEIQVGTPSGKNVQIDVRLAESDEEQKALKKDGGGIYKVEFDIPGVVLCNSDL